jgi:hypothetical protein
MFLLGVAIWFFGSLAVGCLAQSRGRSCGWFLTSFLGGLFLTSTFPVVLVFLPTTCVVFLLCLPRKNLSRTEQLILDSMTDEQKQRVLDACAARTASLHPKPAVTGTGEWRHQG